MSVVSIHAPARGATYTDHGARDSYEVSIHAPARGATVHHHFRRIPDVSIHAPARGATMLVCSICVWIVVSIHAPARGATQDRSPWFKAVSIHAPARGATACQRCDMRSFNPRARAGRDRTSLAVRHATRFVSIHAPARGATLSIMRCSLSTSTFQSTRPRGARR